MGTAAQATGDAFRPESGQISCSMPSTLLGVIRASHGHEGVERLLELSGVEHSPDYLGDVSNWIWYHEANALVEAAAELTGDAHIGRRVGEATVRQHAGTPVATLLRSLGSPEAIYEQLTTAVGKFSTVTDLRGDDVAPGRAVVEARARPGFERHAHLCDWTLGLLSQPPVLFGLPPARVEETHCEIRGDDCCRYEVSWDADAAARAADPQVLVTALEGQLSAMADRLDSMYATARDLIASDDLDAALARITERAATAVRAPSYLLAVRTGRDGSLHVHHRGFPAAEADDAARALLADETADDESRLVAEVASATRSYGRLMAATPSAAFFPHERDLLDVYARYAAAVLDTATALDEARRRHDQARALLDLAQELAVAATREEVGQRLIDAVPLVVDCDRVMFFLWDDEQCELRSPVFGLRPDDTPVLARMAEGDFRPVFVEPEMDDPFVRDVMLRSGDVAAVIVPIAANGRFHGTLNVSVSHGPERLAQSTSLVDLMAGVVAQASTALENARLMETMAHQARHDNLTGLMGHRAFQEALDECLGQDGRFTLATIDIDDFKLINDAHGHPVGDEALRRLADVLRYSVRDLDTVFRVGGEEFAVLLPGLTATDALPVAERLRTAVAQTECDPPLRISVGLASWPEDAGDRDTLIERADAALYAAKRAGKDRTALAGV